MKDNKYFVKISNEWFYIKNSKSLIEYYDNNHFVIYILLLRNLTLRSTCIFSINMIKDLLLKEKSNDSRQIKIIKDTLISLHKNKLITIYTDCNCIKKFSEFDKNNSKIYYAKVDCLPTDNFFMLYDNEVNKILDYCKGQDKRGISIYNLLVYFAVIIKSINTKNKVGYYTYEVLFNKFGFASDTISRFNNILSELELIRYNNSFYDIATNKNLCNIYARYENEEEFNLAVKNRMSYSDNIVEVKNKKNKQDLKRSLKKKLNARWEKYKNTIFTKEEINELEKLENDYYKLICKEKTDKQLKKIGFQIISTK